MLSTEPRPDPSITSAHQGCAHPCSAGVHAHTCALVHTHHACTPQPPPSSHPPILPLLLFPNTHKTQTLVALTTVDKNTGSTKAVLITSTSRGNTKVVLFLTRASLCACLPACLPAGDPSETWPAHFSPSKAAAAIWESTWERSLSTALSPHILPWWRVDRGGKRGAWTAAHWGVGEVGEVKGRGMWNDLQARVSERGRTVFGWGTASH